MQKQELVNKIVEIRSLKMRKNEMIEEIREETGIDVTVFVYSLILTGKIVSATINYEGEIEIKAVCSSSIERPETVEEFEKYIKAKEEEEAMLIKLANEVKKEIWRDKDDQQTT